MCLSGHFSEPFHRGPHLRQTLLEACVVVVFAFVTCDGRRVEHPNQLEEVFRFRAELGETTLVREDPAGDAPHPRLENQGPEQQEDHLKP
jgi:hypothetical protein